MSLIKNKSWSPYLAGASIGVLETIAMASAKRPLGITTVFEDSVSLVFKKVVPKKKDAGDDKETKEILPSLAWEGGLVGGVLLGSLLSSFHSGDRPKQHVAHGWKRYTGAAAGGAIMMIGARMAKGCTSGHGISGTMQFAASSWLFTSLMFVTGAAVAKALNRSK